eukprot:CAMPEP_0203813742 /NCGR_PEP_ID=MMETSP0115-20131106/4888_1 /ASSEMBLY_ACC=CAM_ASM_000227 /TAXON_ID=33651 /ORGANISM="Bicosoecid sp, Strain ms1" /LENGTH=916 /DNA_ID=CAMNT_0050722617 /DNA_START=56 /DNA_END=2806 /DNA_ORIENTATION=-
MAASGSAAGGAGGADHSHVLTRRASFSKLGDSGAGFTPRVAEDEFDESLASDDERTAKKSEKLWALMSSYIGSDIHTIQRSIVNHVEYTLASTRFSFDMAKCYRAAAFSVRDRLIESWNDTNRYFDSLDCKRVNYLSLEYLMGRSMQNALLNMDLAKPYHEALMDLGFSLEELYEQEMDAALGNGGLGRLAACFLDSMATLDLPAWGYGIRYNYGIFRQVIKDGKQVEVPDYWLTFGNPWEIERLDVTYDVGFYGKVETVTDEHGHERKKWVPGELVQAIAYDNPIPGHDTYNTINLRLWRALPSRMIDLESFNSGDYVGAANQRWRAESISSVLYPSDSTYNGKELRLKQQYFFVSATLQDIVRRFKKVKTHTWDEFSDKNAIQLNDTHPSIGIPELMRILVDEEMLEWERAWAITRKTFAYTNHTILPEALERWSAGMMGHLLPRHLEIIYKINWHFLNEVRAAFPGDMETLRQMSIVEEGAEKMIRMANLSIVGSHTVNGVAEIHSELVKSYVFPKFYAMFPDRFQNKTNGVTPRRWINQANPRMSAVITELLDTDEWINNLDLVAGLRPLADSEDVLRTWMKVKADNKARLAKLVKDVLGLDLRVDALFDVQVKRIHEYKRQLMNCLYCIHRYRWIKSLPAARRAAEVTPRVVLFGGKSAPGYARAKRIIQLIHAVGKVVNNDPDIGDLFKVIFFPNYNVSNAEVIIPASDLSQHISTAGMEASGTSNMKFAMNGGLIIGTMDGANIEIAAAIGEENMFIFGALTEDVDRLRFEQQQVDEEGKEPPIDPGLSAVLDDLTAGVYGDFADIVDALTPAKDYYLLAHDFPQYCEAQERVDAAYRKPLEWAKKSLTSTAGMGRFSTDRTISEYASEIWDVKPARRPDPTSTAGKAMTRVRSFPNFDPNTVLAATKA